MQEVSLLYTLMWLQPCRQIRLIAYLIKTRFVWFAAHCVWDEMKILLISVGFYSVCGKQNICLQTIIVIVDCCFFFAIAPLVLMTSLAWWASCWIHKEYVASSNSAARHTWLGLGVVVSSKYLTMIQANLVWGESVSWVFIFRFVTFCWLFTATSVVLWQAIMSAPF